MSVPTPRNSMVNQHQLNELEERLKKLITTEEQRAKSKEEALQEQISSLVLENTLLKDELAKQSHTILLDTIKVWIDGIYASVNTINKDIGTLTYRLDKEEETLKEEREENSYESLQREINNINEAVKLLSNDLGELKSKVGPNADNDKPMGSEGNFHESRRRHVVDAVKGGELTLTTLIQRVDRLEDNSRRDNVIFYGIQESLTKETWNDCENIIQDIIRDHKLVDEHTTVEICRAHRLGKWDAEKNRPIIVKFAQYKIKDTIIGNAKNLEDLDYSLSEDFCKNTSEIRKKLYNHGKAAKNRTNIPIKSFSVKYKTLNVVTNTDGKFNFTLDYIEKHPSSWHVTLK